MTTTFITYTVGLIGYAPGAGRPTMLKAEFHRLAGGDIQLRLVSGNSLGELPVKRVTVTHDDWEALEHRPGTVEEAQWALRQLGVEV